ncbi:hypothetical protein [Geothermobacter hydrogeniphilus]|uniref:Uncharacterized protein n=1 Tax=Geothermobacter hydrogeniphilus TaxID=1969733 RepID=A0A1X0Y0P1_9BACT|nr:hypothetical protein [Geothermobacter hydrogeniphilus]ORJ58679.1 hypothetical protein B5V00_11290 [Geothermobacter hydrogeniphilus]
MNKNKISEKQSELKSWLKKIGLSQNEFAALFLEETYEYVTDKEIKRFQESFKKQLRRKSTKPERIEAYLEYLYTTEKFKEAGYIKPQSFSGDILEPIAAKMMRKISKELTEKIEL